MTAVIQQHIHIDDAGVAWIGDTNIKVIEIALDLLAYGWSPEEIAYQYANALSLAQVHAALSFYYDHKDELDAVLQRRCQEAGEIKARLSETPGRRKLRQLGLRP